MINTDIPAWEKKGGMPRVSSFQDMARAKVGSLGARVRSRDGPWMSATDVADVETDVDDVGCWQRASGSAGRALLLARAEERPGGPRAPSRRAWPIAHVRRTASVYHGRRRGGVSGAGWRAGGRGYGAAMQH